MTTSCQFPLANLAMRLPAHLDGAMKNYLLRTLGTLGFVLMAHTLSAQIWDPASSTYNGTAFISSGAGIGRTDNIPDGTTAYGGGSVAGGNFVFGFSNIGGVPAFANYNLGSTDLTAGITLSLVFTGVTAAPKYVAYTGGTLTSYAYNSGTQTLSITASTVATATSASGTLSSAFGLMIVNSGADFGGTVFRSNGYWGDIAPLASGYSGGDLLVKAGVNFNGVAGNSVAFDAYLPASFLSSVGLNQPADGVATIQKPGSVTNLLTTTTYFGPVDPGFPGGGYTYGGGSNYDFNGGGTDPFILASYSNSSWSDGNIGISAVPEPSTYAAILGVAALGVAAIRRRRKS
jgi:hypothetical protein